MQLRELKILPPHLHSSDFKTCIEFSTGTFSLSASASYIWLTSVGSSTPQGHHCQFKMRRIHFLTRKTIGLWVYHVKGKKSLLLEVKSVRRVARSVGLLYKCIYVRKLLKNGHSLVCIDLLGSNVHADDLKLIAWRRLSTPLGYGAASAHARIPLWCCWSQHLWNLQQATTACCCSWGVWLKAFPPITIHGSN